MTTNQLSQVPALSGEELRAIETLYRAFTDKNPDLLDEACTPDWQDIPLLPGQGPGPNGLKEMLPMFFQAFPDLKIVVHEIVGSAGRAGVRASITGTHRGEIFGVPPTGQAVGSRPARPSHAAPCRHAPPIHTFRCLTLRRQSSRGDGAR